MAAPIAEHFQPRDTLANTASTTLQTTAGGVLLAGAQNALRKQNVGARGIFTHSGYIITLFAGAGATFQFVRDSSANLRRKDDSYNEFLGGFAAGMVAGIPRRSYAAMLGFGAGVGVVMAAYSYSGGLRGEHAHEERDEVERKWEEMRKYRSPIEETIAEIGEGRGIYAPGYKERRRERLLAKYGIDVNAAQETAK